LVRHPIHFAALVLSLTLIAGVTWMLVGYFSLAYHRQAARSAVEKYHSEEARRHLEKCLQLQPRDRESLLLATRTARRLGAYDEAEGFLDRYKDEVDKDNDDLLLERLLLRIEQGEPDRFRRLCQDMVEKEDPSAFLVLEALVRAYVRMYRPGDADFCLRFWLERESDNTQAVYLKGLVREQMGREQEAIDEYRQVLKLDPQFHPARARMCNLLLARYGGDEALPHLEYLEKEQPGNLDTQVMLAKCLDQLGQRDQAEEILDSVLASHPYYPDALAQRGKLALRAGQYEQAEAWLREAVRLMPGEHEAQDQLYKCLSRQGKTEEARKAEMRLKEIEDDIEHLHELVTQQMPRSPHDARLHYQAGMLALRAGMVQEAIRWFESAVRENPGHVEAHKALARYYRRVGQRLIAREHERKANTGRLDRAPAGSSGGLPLHESGT
jgi:tetratricopeptide (TPR) repeat protein